MDEEDLADAEEARKIHTAEAFAGLGAASTDVARTHGLAGVFRVQGETMGAKLLKKMGWKEGQGIGPKVRRKANLDVASETGANYKSDTYLFAPENVAMVGFVRKMDRKGLGHGGQSKLAPLASSEPKRLGQLDDEDDDDGGASLGRPRGSISLVPKKKERNARGGIGIGVLNDTGSDDEDPYEIGPRISYNRILGGDKKRKKKDTSITTSVNPSVKAKPVFMSKKTTLARVALGVRKCHDGRLPLEGFMFGQDPDPSISMINADGKYPPPAIPPDWKSGKLPKGGSDQSNFVSTANAAKASTLDHKSRAALLGEKQLPGKSVFDFLSSSARGKIAAVTGKANLPQAKGEIPEGYGLSEEEKKQEFLKQIPELDKQSAVAAITRGAAGGGPYGDNESKRSRYRAYLEHEAGFGTELPTKPPHMAKNEWLQEFNEFYNVARIFRPMTGTMASRFTTSSTTSPLASGSDGKANPADLLFKPPAKPEDPAEAAARMGMYGHMTRSVHEFMPTRLLCKRFNVKPPAHTQPEESTNSKTPAPHTGLSPMNWEPRGADTGSGINNGEELLTEAGSQPSTPRTKEASVDASKNEALEGKRAGEEVFKAIFGNSSDDEESRE